MRSENLYSPKQLLRKYPGAPFSESDLGRLLRLNLLEGFQSKRETLIEENSFLNLLEYMNKIIDLKKVQISR